MWLTYYARVKNDPQYAALAQVRLCKGFSDACITTATPKHRQQASEKRQGTKIAGGGAGDAAAATMGIRRVDADQERGEKGFRWGIGV